MIALMLGPSGLGLVGLYTSTTGLLGTVAGLGIGASGVREVAEAHGSGVPEKVASTALALRRACWVTGAFGWLLAAALSYPLSLWAFESKEFAWPIAILGITILLTALSSAQLAVLQGTRRIGELARLSILSVSVSTVVAVAIYAVLGEQGIVPVLIATAAINLILSWWFARRLNALQVTQTWRETLVHARRHVGLGMAFMWSGVLAALVDLAIRALIVREHGLDGNGMYQAAWGISGMFAAFVLGAMGTDFYPRLAGVAHDSKEVNRMVNEQTEIGILLALPGLLATLAFAPWVMHIFYSAKFAPASTLLPWLVLGIFGQVVSWPMSFILIAKGAKGWMAITETFANTLKLGLSAVLLYYMGLEGIAVAVPTMYVAYMLLVLVISRSLTGFCWDKAARGVLVVSCVLTTLAFVAKLAFSPTVSLWLIMLITAIGSLFSLQGILNRVPRDNRIAKWLRRIPVVRYLEIR